MVAPTVPATFNWYSSSFVNIDMCPLAGWIVSESCVPTRINIPDVSKSNNNLSSVVLKSSRITCIFIIYLICIFYLTNIANVVLPTVRPQKTPSQLTS